jgi:hypothetical protein
VQAGRVEFRHLVDDERNSNELDWLNFSTVPVSAVKNPWLIEIERL